MRWECEPLTTGFVSHPLFFLFFKPSLLDFTVWITITMPLSKLYISVSRMYFYIIWSPEASHMFHSFPYVFPHCIKTHLLNKSAFRVFLTLMSMNMKNAVFFCFEIMLDLKKALKPWILLHSKSICLGFFCLLPDTWFCINVVFVQSHFFTLPVTFHSPHPGSVFTTRQHIFSFNGFPVNFHFTLWHRIKFLTSHAKVCTPTLNNK